MTISLSVCTMIFVLLVCPLHKWVPKCDITFFFSFFLAGWWGDMRKATYKSYRRAMQFWCVFMIRKITWILTKKRTNENIIWRCNRNDDVNKPWHPNLCTSALPCVWQHVSHSCWSKGSVLVRSTHWNIRFTGCHFNFEPLGTT